MSLSHAAKDSVDGGDSNSAQQIADGSERLRSNFLDLADAVIVTDPLGNIVLLNHAAESLTGWMDCDAKDQPIESVFRIIHEVTRQPVIQPVKRVIEHGIIQHVAQFTLLIAKDGVERAIDDSATPIRDAGGNLDGVVLIFKDISDRREWEKGLEDSRRQAEVIIASVRDSLIVLDDDLRVRSANHSFYATFRTSPDQTIGRSLFELGDGQWNVDRFRAALEDMCARDLSLPELDIEWVFPESGPKALHVRGNKLHRANGREALILLVIEDMTDRRRAERSLADSELRFRRLFEAAKDGILIVDPESGAITDANPFVLEMLGCSHIAVVGKRLWEIGLLGDEQASRAYFRELQENGYIRYEDLPLKCRGGDQVDVEVISNVYTSGNRNVIQCNLRDVTVRKRNEKLLARRAEELARSNRDLEQFAFVASHDLQEPLRAISGVTELLAERYRGRLDEKADLYISTIVDGCHRMRQLIGGLLAYSRVITRSLPFEPIDSEAVLKSTLADLQSAIAAVGAEVTHSPLPTVVGNPTLIGQLLQNLIGNALKFRSAQAPRVHISAQCDHEFWSFAVADNGIGIDSQYAEQIFAIFQRLHTRDEYPGTGIGLAICRKIVEQHGGRIWVESQPGQGSTFRFTLPKTPVDACP